MSPLGPKGDFTALTVDVRVSPGSNIPATSSDVRFGPIRDTAQPSSAGVRNSARRPSAFVRRIEQHTGSRKTAIDIEHVAGDVGGISGCEESSCGRDVGRLRVPL